MPKFFIAFILVAIFSFARAQSFSYSGAPVFIPDANPAAKVGAPITVAGLARPIQHVTISIDGSTCTNAPGATTVGLDHTFIFDLALTVRSPNGTEVIVANRIGNDGNNLCQVLFDDSAAASIQSVNNANAPFTGVYKPFEALSTFAGEIGNGVWTLQAQDFSAADTGNIRAWTINITQVPPPLVQPTAIPTLSELGLIFLSSLVALAGAARARHLHFFARKDRSYSNESH